MIITGEKIDWNPSIRLWFCTTYRIPSDFLVSLSLSPSIYIYTFHYFFAIHYFIFHFLHSCATNNRPSTYVFLESPADMVLCKQENKAGGSEVPFIQSGQFSNQNENFEITVCGKTPSNNIALVFIIATFIYLQYFYTSNKIFKHFLYVGDPW